MDYITSPEMSEKEGISSRRISLLCAKVVSKEQSKMARLG